MGALVNQAQYQGVIGHIDRGLSAGATLVCGGQRPAHLPRGYFLQPTVFTDVPVDSALWCEDIFGPVLCVRRFTSAEKAIALRSEERRVGKECGSTCRSRGSAEHTKQKRTRNKS